MIRSKRLRVSSSSMLRRKQKREMKGESGAPNENIVQSHLDIALLNVF